MLIDEPQTHQPLLHYSGLSPVPSLHAPESRMLVENDFGPAEAAGRSQTWPVEA